MTLPNRIRKAADARSQRDAQLRPELAQRAEEVFEHLEPQLRQWASAPSAMGLVIDYLIERSRQYRHECEIELIRQERIRTRRHLSEASYKADEEAK
jgi:hypothetical protein